MAMLPYTYVPGRAPHPIREEGGHRMGDHTPKNESLEPNAWPQCDAYQYAVELFNAGYYWEAHEVWEGSWHQAGRSGTTADFLKALIKLAAALVKAREGRLNGVHRHATRARQLLELVQSSSPAEPITRYAGLQIEDLLHVADQLVASDEAWLAARAKSSVTVVNPLIEHRLTLIGEKQ